MVIPVYTSSMQWMAQYTMLPLFTQNGKINIYRHEQEQWTLSDLYPIPSTELKVLQITTFELIKEPSLHDVRNVSEEALPPFQNDFLSMPSPTFIVTGQQQCDARCLTEHPLRKWIHISCPPTWSNSPWYTIHLHTSTHLTVVLLNTDNNKKKGVKEGRKEKKATSAEEKGLF